jgi:hypothetical protein
VNEEKCRDDEVPNCQQCEKIANVSHLLLHYSESFEEGLVPPLDVHFFLSQKILICWRKTIFPPALRTNPDLIVEIKSQSIVTSVAVVEEVYEVTFSCGG